MPENALTSHLWSHTRPSPDLVRSSFPPQPGLQISGQQAPGGLIFKESFIHPSIQYLQGPEGLGYA